MPFHFGKYGHNAVSPTVSYRWLLTCFLLFFPAPFEKLPPKPDSKIQSFWVMPNLEVISISDDNNLLLLVHTMKSTALDKFKIRLNVVKL